MGIHDLSKFIRDQCSDVLEVMSLSTFAYKKIAIDTSLYMYTYKASHKQDWLSAFANLVCILRKNDIHCTFVYDGQAPCEKSEERAKRAEQRNKLKDKVYDLEQAMEHYHQTHEILPILLEFQKDKNIGSNSLLTTNKIFPERLIQTEINRLKDQLIDISPKDFETTKQLFDLLQIPYITAPTEAEKFCSDLCKRGEVDAVLSEDTDVLAYGCPIFLTKINTKAETFTVIQYENVLTRFNLTSPQFLDFCILCGTDYNSRIPKIGPVKAYKLLEEYKTIEGIEQAGFDTSLLKYKRVRELFTEFPPTEFKVRYCGTPEYTNLAVFFKVKNIRMDVELLKQWFERNL